VGCFGLVRGGPPRRPRASAGRRFHAPSARDSLAPRERRRPAQLARQDLWFGRGRLRVPNAGHHRPRRGRHHRHRRRNRRVHRRHTRPPGRRSVRLEHRVSRHGHRQALRRLPFHRPLRRRLREARRASALGLGFGALRAPVLHDREHARLLRRRQRLDRYAASRAIALVLLVRAHAPVGHGRSSLALRRPRRGPHCRPLHAELDERPGRYEARRGLGVGQPGGPEPAWSHEPTRRTSPCGGRS
jgi:hypothetical protein